MAHIIIPGLALGVTMDVNISYDGKIYEPHLKQLIEIGKSIR